MMMRISKKGLYKNKAAIANHRKRNSMIAAKNSAVLRLLAMKRALFLCNIFGKITFYSTYV